VPLAKFNRYVYTKIARFMQKLDQLGVLDSTLIYVTSDMGNPALHSTRNVPTLLAGGLNGKFRMGRRLKLKPDCPTESPWCSLNDTTFTPVTNNKLLVSIAQAFGDDIDTFGTQPDPAHTTGALSEVT
jgi:arylsulfatase A-like enzyme